MKLKESLSEASGEGRCRLGNSSFGSCKLSSKSGKEVILSLFRCKDRYRRKYSECICGKEDYILSCRCGRNRTYNVLNMIDRIRYTGILGNALICEINLTSFIYGYVLKKSISLDCVVDIRLRILVKVDNLSVASTFEVEYAVVIPTMLVITNQETLRICGKCCLTCSGKTKEDCGVLTVLICICGAVHRSNTLKRKVIVHHGEHTLLHFSAVPCVDDYLLTAGNVECYTCFRV